MDISSESVLSLLQRTRDTQTGAEPFDGFPVAAADRDVFIHLIHATTTSPRLLVRCAAVLLAAAGWSNSHIARQIHISRRTVALWKTRYRAGGVPAVMADAPGRGRKPGRNKRVVSQILETTRQLPPNGARWTVRTLARSVGVSHATVQRVWREYGVTRPATPDSIDDSNLVPARSI